MAGVTAPNAASTPSATAHAAPKAPANEQEPPDGALGLVIANVATTDMSALVTITSARIEGPNGAPAPATRYVRHVYVIDVVTCIRGCGTAKSFTFVETAEAGIPTQKIGDAIVVSACRDG